MIRRLLLHDLFSRSILSMRAFTVFPMEFVVVNKCVMSSSAVSIWDSVSYTLCSCASFCSLIECKLLDSAALTAFIIVGLKRLATA